MRPRISTVIMGDSRPRATIAAYSAASPITRALEPSFAEPAQIHAQLQLTPRLHSKEIDVAIARQMRRQCHQQKT